MKSICTPLLALLLLPSICAAQNTPAKPAARTDVYHVYFAKAALGKAGQLGDYLKTPDPKAPMPGHFLVLRHQDGDAWDYVVIEHLGTKFTVDAAGNPQPASARDLGDWHNDTFVNGPPWSEFASAMGIAVAGAASLLATSTFAQSSARGSSGFSFASSRRISFDRSSAIRGTTTFTSTYWSPRTPGFKSDGAPLPRIRRVWPDWVPGGMRIIAGPSTVGTRTFVPSAASVTLNGTVQ